jgi:hypothetical protein
VSRRWLPPLINEAARICASSRIKYGVGVARGWHWASAAADNTVGRGGPVLGQQVNPDFVLANPGGPIHVLPRTAGPLTIWGERGYGRGSVTGDGQPPGAARVSSPGRW